MPPFNIRRRAIIGYSQRRDRRDRNALRRAILQFSEPSEHGAEHGHDVLPRFRRADGNEIPRVWARFGVRSVQNASKDAPVQVDEVVQKHLTEATNMRCASDDYARKEGKRDGTHRVKNVFAFADIDGLLERERKLGHEFEENRSGGDWPCCFPDDG